MGLYVLRSWKLQVRFDRKFTFDNYKSELVNASVARETFEKTFENKKLRVNNWKENETFANSQSERLYLHSIKYLL